MDGMSLEALWAPLLVNALRGAALLLLVHVGLFALRRESAARQDLAWRATFAALLLLPFVGLLLPGWSVSWLRGLFGGAGVPGVAGVAVGAWLAGVLALLGLFGLRHGRAWLLQQGAEPVADGAWTVLARAAARRVDPGRGRVPSVRVSARVAVPLVVRSDILLPADADEWDLDRRRIVLLHEAAHVARGDYGARLLTDVACALHWFNPLVWLARRRVAVLREQACDDAVLAAGVGSGPYARQLLSFARRVARSPFGAVAGLTMARPSSLEARLRALHDGGRDRRGASTRARLATAVAAALLVLALGSAEPAPPGGAAAPDAPWTPAAAPGAWEPSAP